MDSLPGCFYLDFTKVSFFAICFHMFVLLRTCRAGVGRSGTYIALDVMLDQLEDEKVIDVCGFVTHARSQRNLMVQTEVRSSNILCYLWSFLCNSLVWLD